MTRQEIRMALIIGGAVLVFNLIGLSIYEWIRTRGIVAPPGVTSAEGLVPLSQPRILPEPPPVDGSACMDDSDTFCSGRAWTLPGTGACLFAHLNELKPACRDKIPDMFPHFKGCWKEILELCHDVPKRDGMVAKCLRKKANLVSEVCRNSPYFAK